MAEFSFTRIDNWFRAYEKFPYKYILVSRDTNIFGHMTRFYLFRCFKNRDNFPIAKLDIFNLNQDKGTLFSPYLPFNTYIADIESAIRILLFLSYEERTDFITTFNIDFEPIVDNSIFTTCVQGHLSLKKWQDTQNRIKNIISFPENLSTEVSLLCEN